MKRNKRFVLILSVVMIVGVSVPTLIKDKHTEPAAQNDAAVAVTSPYVITTKVPLVNAAPIDLTFIKPEVAIIDQLNASNYRALYMDNETYVRVTKDGAIQVSADQGGVWDSYAVDEVSAPYFSDWLEQNDPNPDGYVRRGMLDAINNGATIKHAIFNNGKELFFVMDGAEVLLELCTPNKLEAVLIDGQKLMFTGGLLPLRVSESQMQTFYDLMVANKILSPAEAEQDYDARVEKLKQSDFL